MTANTEPATHLSKAEDTIHKMLESILSQEDVETADTLADAINLYIKAMRRRDGRIKFGPADIHGFLTMVHVLLTVPTLEDQIVKLYSGKPAKETRDVQS